MYVKFQLLKYMNNIRLLTKVTRYYSPLPWDIFKTFDRKPSKINCKSQQQIKIFQIFLIL